MSTEQLFIVRTIVDLASLALVAFLGWRWLRRRLNTETPAQIAVRERQIAAALAPLAADYATLHGAYTTLKAQMGETMGDHAKVTELAAEMTTLKRRVQVQEKATRNITATLASIQDAQARHERTQARQTDLLQDLQITVSAGTAAALVLARQQVPPQALQSAGIIIDQAGVRLVGDAAQLGGVRFGDQARTGAVAGNDINTPQGGTT